MTSKFDSFPPIFKAKHEALTLELARREDITIERAPDTLDEVQLAAARDLSTRSLERNTRLLREVRAALDRIRNALLIRWTKLLRRIGVRESLTYCRLCFEISGTTALKRIRSE